MTVAKLSELIEKYAQLTSAQAGDIENALRKANLWDKAGEIAPTLNQASVSDSATVQVSLVVNKDLSVGFIVSLNPRDDRASSKLSGILRSKYSAAMKSAIKAAGLAVSDKLVVKWLSY